MKKLKKILKILLGIILLLVLGFTNNETNDKSKNAQVVYPIIVEGESIGSVILLSKEPNSQMTEVEQKVVQSAASFLGTQMEI